MQKCGEFDRFECLVLSCSCVFFALSSFITFLRAAKGALVDVFNGDYRSILASKITSRPKLKHLSLIAKLILFRSMTSCQGEVH